MTAFQDLPLAIRQLRREPLFTITVLLMLGVGTALNSAMFSLVYAALLRPLPLTDSERIVAVREVHPDRGQTVVTPGNFLGFRDNRDIFQFASGSMTIPLELSGIDEPERVEALFVLDHFFSVLDVAPLSGRLIDSADYGSGWEPRFGLFGLGRSVVLSERFWRRRFGADPSVVGRDVRLDGSPVHIVGVTPSELHAIWPDVDLIVPWILPPDAAEVRQPHEIPALARLARGVTLEQASSVMAEIYRRFESDYPETNPGWMVRLIPLQEYMFGSTRQRLLLLQGSAGLVLLLVSFNIANLFLAHSEGRRREIAIRRAVGASTFRIIQHVLTQSGALGFVSGFLAILMSTWALPLLAGLAESVISPFPITPRLDGTLIAFTLGSSLVAGLAFGLAPAVHSASSVPARSVGVPKGFSSGTPFVAAQVAVAVVLLAAGALMLQDLLSLERKAPGFEPAGRLALQISLPESRYREWARAHDFIERALEEIRAIPGVSAAETTTLLPMTRNDTNLCRRHRDFDPDDVLGLGASLPSRRPHKRHRFAAP
jgi:putative ABC transport system permease protein